MVTDDTLSRFWGQLLLYATQDDVALREYLMTHPTTRYSKLPTKFYAAADRLLRQAFSRKLELPSW